MVPLTSRTILKERMSRLQWIAVILCIIGSALIFYGLIHSVEFEDGSHLRHPAISNTTFPDFENSTQSQESNKQHMTTNVRDFIIGLVMAISAGISTNLYTAMTRLLQGHLKSPVILVVWFDIVSILVSSVLMLVLEINDLALPSNANGWLYFALHLLASLTATTYYIALYFATAVVCNITFNLEIPISMLCQYVIFAHLQPIDGSLYDVIGGSIITFGIVLPSIYDFKQYLMERKLQSIEQHQKQSNEPSAATLL